MKFLRDLVTLAEKKEDLSRLPKDVMSAIQSNIRKGAEDLSQDWANALELVHKAYEVEGVERPEPSMETAWKQYEENLQYAVSQLAENRGMEDDWRMSSSMFHEALNPTPPVRVKIKGQGVNESYTVRAKNVDEVIDMFEATDFDVQTKKQGNQTVVEFSKWGIRKKFTVNISSC